jgi:hypothetical protein
MFAGPDVICCVTGSPGGDIHHLLTRKSHPEFKDKSWNQIPLSHSLHVMIHAKGLNYMARNFPSIETWLIENGWERDEFKKKWFHPAAVQRDN